MNKFKKFKSEKILQSIKPLNMVLNRYLAYSRFVKLYLDKIAGLRYLNIINSIYPLSQYWQADNSSTNVSLTQNPSLEEKDTSISDGKKMNESLENAFEIPSKNEQLDNFYHPIKDNQITKSTSDNLTEGIAPKPGVKEDRNPPLVTNLRPPLIQVQVKKKIFSGMDSRQNYKQTVNSEDNKRLTTNNSEKSIPEINNHDSAAIIPIGRTGKKEQQDVYPHYKRANQETKTSIPDLGEGARLQPTGKENQRPNHNQQKKPLSRLQIKKKKLTPMDLNSHQRLTNGSPNDLLPMPTKKIEGEMLHQANRSSHKKYHINVYRLPKAKSFSPHDPLPGNQHENKIPADNGYAVNQGKILSESTARSIHSSPLDKSDNLVKETKEIGKTKKISLYHLISQPLSGLKLNPALDSLYTPHSPGKSIFFNANASITFQKNYCAIPTEYFTLYTKSPLQLLFPERIQLKNALHKGKQKKMESRLFDSDVSSLRESTQSSEPRENNGARLTSQNINHTDHPILPHLKQDQFPSKDMKSQWFSLIECTLSVGNSAYSGIPLTNSMKEIMKLRVNHAGNQEEVTQRTRSPNQTKLPSTISLSVNSERMIHQDSIPNLDETNRMPEGQLSASSQNQANPGKSIDIRKELYTILVEEAKRIGIQI